MIIPVKLKTKKERIEMINNIAKNLKQNAEEITSGWDKKLLQIKITTIIRPDEIITNKIEKKFFVEEYKKWQ